MGSIPVRSTKKHRMQNCIRCFFGTPSREFVLGSSIRQSRILAEGIPLAGNGKFPHISTKTIIIKLHSVFLVLLTGNTQPLSLVECFFLCKAVALFACGRIKARSYAFFFFNTRKIIIIKATIAATQTTAIIA